jgi:hypothetical protein
MMFLVKIQANMVVNQIWNIHLLIFFLYVWLPHYKPRYKNLMIFTLFFLDLSFLVIENCQISFILDSLILIFGKILPLKKWCPKLSLDFFPILWCSQIGNDPQFNLAKFDYGQGMQITHLKGFFWLMAHK